VRKHPLWVAERDHGQISELSTNETITCHIYDTLLRLLFHASDFIIGIGRSSLWCQQYRFSLLLTPAYRPTSSTLISWYLSITWIHSWWRSQNVPKGAGFSCGLAAFFEHFIDDRTNETRSCVIRHHRVLHWETCIQLDRQVNPLLFSLTSNRDCVFAIASTTIRW
jgi:hypothetical protein